MDFPRRFKIKPARFSVRRISPPALLRLRFRACQRGPGVLRARTPGGSRPAARFRAVSSVGRASRLHREGRRFEPVTAHQNPGMVDVGSRDLGFFALSSPSVLARARLFAAFGSSAHAMEFRLRSVGEAPAAASHCPRVIVAEGQITNSTPDEFLQFLRENAANQDLRTVVLLNSQGGYVVASMELGPVLPLGRDRGSVAVRRGRRLDHSFLPFGLRLCLHGRRKRVAPRRERRLASTACSPIRQRNASIRRCGAVYDDGSMAGMLMRYSARMGVSRDLIRYAEHISSQIDPCGDVGRNGALASGEPRFLRRRWRGRAAFTKSPYQRLTCRRRCLNSQASDRRASVAVERGSSSVG